MRIIKILSFLIASILLPLSSFAACTSPSNKTYSGLSVDKLFFVSKDYNNEVWARNTTARWVFSNSPSTSKTTQGTLTITGYQIGSDGIGNELVVDSKTARATWYFSFATCRGEITVAPITKPTVANTVLLTFHVSGNGNTISVINKNTPTPPFTQPVDKNTKLNLIGSGVLHLE